MFDVSFAEQKTEFDASFAESKNDFGVDLDQLQVLKGDKGDPFTFEDFTPEQLESLRGPQGLPGKNGQNGKDGKNGINGVDGKDGRDGLDGSNGSDGATFTPFIDANGNLSWTNNKGLTNPSTVNIMGPQGSDGKNGSDGRDGIDGSNGLDGSDGATFKPTVNANGDLSWTNDQGLANPETVNIKGPKGDTGQDGKAFTFADFTPEQIESLKVKGDDGLDGKDGQDGKTPVLGTDYFTEADKQEIVNSVLASLVDGDKEAY